MTATARTLLAAALVLAGAAERDCESQGARHLHPDGDDNPVAITPPYFTEDFVAEVTIRAEGGSLSPPPARCLWECSSADGADVLGVYATGDVIYVQTANATHNETTEFAVPARFDLTDGGWHRIAVNHSAAPGAGASLAVAINGHELAAVGVAVAATPGRRGACRVGGAAYAYPRSSSTAAFPPVVFEGGVRDFGVSAYVDGVHKNTTAALCSGGCNGPYATRRPVRNIAAIPDEVATSDAPMVVEFYINVVDVVAERHTVVLAGGGDGDCLDETLAGAVEVYIFPNGGGYGVGARQRRLGREDIAISTPVASVKLLPQRTYSVRVAFGGDAQRLYVNGVVVAKAGAAAGAVAAGGVSVGTSCHREVRNAPRAWLQAVVVGGGCDGFLTGALPRGELAPNPTPPPDAIVQPTTPVTGGGPWAYWMPTQLSGSIMVATTPTGATKPVPAFQPTPGWSSAVNHANAMLQAPHTQWLAFATGDGLYYSEDGGLTYHLGLAGVALDDAAMFAGGTVAVLVSSAKQMIYRHEVGAPLDAVRQYPLPVPVGVSPQTQLRVFANEAGEVFVTTYDLHVFVSTDAGMSYVHDRTLSNHLKDVIGTGSTPLVSAPADPHDIPHPQHARRVIACAGRVFTQTYSIADREWNRWFELRSGADLGTITAVHKIRGYIYLVSTAALGAGRVFRGRERGPGLTMDWRVMYEGTGDDKPTAIHVRVDEALPAATPTLVMVAERKLLVSRDLGVRWEELAVLQGSFVERGLLGYYPTCTRETGCSGRGDCRRGLIWPGQPATCDCDPPYAPPTCAARYTCGELEALTGEDLRCANATLPAPPAHAACEWRTVEVRPGIKRARCLQPDAQP